MSEHLPQGWGKSTVGESCISPQYGYTESACYEPVGPKFLRITDISERGVNWDNVPFCTCSDKDFSKFRLQSKDIVFARIGATTGKSYLISECPEAVYASYLIRLRCKENVDAGFLWFFFNSKAYWIQIDKNKGNNLKGGVNASILKQVEHPLPPLPEQRSIATVLSKIQESIAAQQEIIDRTRELKKALMAKLFTEIISNSPKKRIDSFADVKGGKRLPKGESFADGETQYPYIRVVDMKDNSVMTNDLKYLTPEIQKTISRYTINIQDLYISIAGTIGMVGKIPEFLDGANLTENAAKIVFHESAPVTSDYLMWYLDSETGQVEIASRTTKTSQPKLALARICSIEVPVPAENIQVDLSNVLSTMLEKRRAAEVKKQLLQDLFKTMLHELMTGNIRTTPLMEA